MERLKVGDRVIIRQPIDEDESPGFNSAMRKMVGTIHKIEYVRTLESSGDQFVAFGDLAWSWRGSWLDKVEDNTIAYTDLVIIRE